MQSMAKGTPHQLGQYLRTKSTGGQEAWGGVGPTGVYWDKEREKNTAMLAGDDCNRAGLTFQEEEETV